MHAESGTADTCKNGLIANKRRVYIDGPSCTARPLYSSVDFLELDRKPQDRIYSIESILLYSRKVQFNNILHHCTCISPVYLHRHTPAYFSRHGFEIKSCPLAI